MKMGVTRFILPEDYSNAILDRDKTVENLNFHLAQLCNDFRGLKLKEQQECFSDTMKLYDNKEEQRVEYLCSTLEHFYHDALELKSSRGGNSE